MVVRKCVGLLRDVSWADLGDIARPGSSFQLRKLAGSGNPYTTILDPYTVAADRTRGRELFERYCAKCHGPKASGGFGPALVGRQFVHGDRTGQSIGRLHSVCREPQCKAVSSNAAMSGVSSHICTIRSSVGQQTTG